MTVSLENQVAVITGGSRGIGAATVRLFARAGARVVFSYHVAARAAHNLARDCAGARASVWAMRADVAKGRDAARLVSTALRRFGRLDVLVANAGIWNADPLPVQEMTERQWDEMMEVNARGVFNAIHYAVPAMVRQKSGRIIVVSSTAGQRGEAFHSHYGASKGALISLVKSLATELAPQGVLVNSVAPGWVDTEMCLPVTRHPREIERVTGGIPLGRFARPEEIALPILFLASEMASYITGEVLNVNGGSVLCG